MGEHYCRDCERVNYECKCGLGPCPRCGKSWGKCKHARCISCGEVVKVKGNDLCFSCTYNS